MSIEVNNESGVDADLEAIERLIRHILQTLRVHPEAEVSVILLDEQGIERLHVDWMDLDGPTDVMSFPMDELRPGTPGALSPAGMLGDLVICPQVAARQAESGGHSTADEILLLATHGTLHLLGFDHEEPEEKEEMFSLQRTLLEEFTGRKAPRETTE
ncbi:MULTISPECIES: rRNA maturation RNase YbeY [Micrococcaceae]|uniref:Endoribonuclease YbeY n=1 Tax=Arthrobacter rhombi TaxID=71253 RepID=A0A1R4GV69_9MICC|nr:MULTISPECIES: rRNA maturation RNase YbeY [Micrococcaceae]PCC26667.1 rRNA maturation RNase YbeY [Glutamicibacter sp. BW78]SJM72011.1 Metal-dependent hydrolase YbeY, involved in rRNA and/or ribosome maturation and assembly [Arthrobacter rhombi]